MDFISAVKSVLTQYVGFSGRACRSEFWWFFLFTWIIDSLLWGIVENIVSLAIFLPIQAMSIRRLHDINKSGWWLLPALTLFLFNIAERMVSFGFKSASLYFVSWVIVAVYVYVFTKKGEVGDNLYGADPLAVEAEVDAPQT